MKTFKIRQNVFETNSSSTHSISISKDNFQDLMEIVSLDDNSNITLISQDFGWEQDEFNDFYSKATYLFIYASDWSDGRRDEFKKRLFKVIKEQTGAKDILLDIDSYGDLGHIDHQSVYDNQLHYIFEDEELIRQFLFNKNSILVTDNDGY